MTPAGVATTTPVPIPADWAKIHSHLVKVLRARGDSSIPSPPMPLILAGAAFSKASEIRQRWFDLIQWTKAHGFERELASSLSAAPKFDVAERIAGVSESGEG